MASNRNPLRTPRLPSIKRIPGQYPPGFFRRPELKPKLKQIIFYAYPPYDRYMEELQERLKNDTAIRQVNMQVLFRTMIDYFHIRFSPNPGLQGLVPTKEQLLERFNEKTGRRKLWGYELWCAETNADWDGRTADDIAADSEFQRSHPWDGITDQDRLEEAKSTIAQLKRQVQWLKMLAFPRYR